MVKCVSVSHIIVQTVPQISYAFGL